MKISIFIPTYNAIKTSRDAFIATLNTIKEANLYKVFIIDSSSKDDTVSIVNEYGFECKVIPQSEFDHGGTRNEAFLYLQDSDYIIYLTQDALVPDVESLHKLVEPLIADPTIGGSYGRQVPHPDADIFAKHLRLFNYLRGSYVRGYKDRFVWGMDCVFSSDSYAAYSVAALKEIGGFPRDVIFGEDVYVFAKLVKAGYNVAYVADTFCYHSHNYKVGNDFSRYFDIGVFHRNESWILNDFGQLNKRGIKYAASEWVYVLKSKPWLFPKSIFKSFAKFLGYKLGYNYNNLGISLCRRFSMNSEFWNKPVTA